MTNKDDLGLTLSGASAFAADNYRQAVRAYHLYAGDPLPLLQAACADSPGFVMGRVLTAYLTLVGSNAQAQAIGVEAFEAVRETPGTDRERGHVAAVGHLLCGEVAAAARVLEDVAIEHPRDTLALHMGQIADFIGGDARMMRDRIGRALPAWSKDMPHYHAVLGLHAFGLEETGLYDRAEAAGRAAIELEPRNGWARHAVAHVLEMQDRRAEGVAWLRDDLAAWTQDSFFQVHNWWHLALFHLGLGETDEVIALYDGPIWGSQSDLSVDLIDAAAMLWRLHLRGVELGGRWAALADVFERRGGLGLNAFEDLHAAMAFVGAGREDAAAAVLAAQAGAVADNAAYVSEVGGPAIEAICAFGRGDYARAVERLRQVRNRSARFGGSHAQRDVLDLTLIEAASRQGDRSLERALLAERAAASPLAAGAPRRLAA
ncbi:MAG: tetratricopeptide repeat protein [Phenylobacterium sp.]|uniref:tetratricopeptide repeat protein n=1 Tax=Phenylobacterium sp. TaxID=1871053 RepID=UPI00391B1FAC